MGSEAQVGLRIYLQDEITPGLDRLSSLLLGLSKIVGDFGTVMKEAMDSGVAPAQEVAAAIQSVATAALDSSKVQEQAAQTAAEATTQAADQIVSKQEEVAVVVEEATVQAAESTRSLEEIVMNMAGTWAILMANEEEAVNALANGSTEFNSIGQVIADLIDPTQSAAINLSQLGEWFVNLAQEVPGLSEAVNEFLLELQDVPNGADGVRYALLGLGQSVGVLENSIVAGITVLPEYVAELQAAGGTTSQLAQAAAELKVQQNGVAQAMVGVGEIGQEVINRQQLMAQVYAAVAQAAGTQVQAQQNVAQAMAGVAQIGQVVYQQMMQDAEDALAARIRDLSQAYLDLAGEQSNVANLQRQMILGDLQALGVTDMQIAQLKDEAQALADTAASANELGDSMGSGFGKIMGLQMLQQYVQQADQAVRGFVTTSSDMQDSLIRVGLAVDMTGTSIDTFNAYLTKASDQSEFSVSQIADTFQLLGERGFTAVQIMGGLGDAIINLATVTGQGLQPNVELLTTAMRDFNIPAKDAEKTAAALDYAFFHGIPNVQGLQTALEHVAPTADAFHVKFTTIVGILTFLSQHGFPDVTAAGTGLNYVMTAMYSPTSTAAKELKSLGVNAYDAQGKVRDLPSVLQDLFTVLDSGTQSQAAKDFRQIFNVKSGQVAHILALDPNFKNDLKKAIDGMTNAQKPDSSGKDALQRQVDQIGSDFKQTMAKLQSTWNSTMGILFKPVIDQLTPFLDNVNKIVTGLTNANPQVKTFIATFGGILLFLGPLLAIGLGIAMIGVALTPILAPVAIVVGALIGLAVVGSLLAANWSKVTAFFAPLEPLFTNIGALIRGSFAPALQQMKDGWNEITTALGPLMAQLRPLIPFFQAAGLIIVGVIAGLLSSIGPVLGALVHMIAGVIAGLMMMLTGTIQFVHGLAQTVQGIIQFVIGFLTGNKAMQVAAQKMFTEGLGNIVAGLMHFIGGALQVVGSILIGFVNGAIALFSHLTSGIMGVLGTFMGGTGPAAMFQKTFDTISQAISAFPAKAIATIQGWVNAVIQWFQHLADVLYVHSIVPDMIKAILGLFTGFASAGRALIQGLISGIIAIFVTLPASTIGHVTSMINGMVGAIRTGAGLFGSAVQNGIINPIQNAIRNLVNMASGWGLNFMNMLKSGIMAGVSAIMGAVNSVAAGIKSVLGFHSPPESGPLADSDQYAPNMMKMFSGGILQHAYLVHSAVGVVAYGLRNGLNTPVVSRLQSSNSFPGGPNGANGANTTINLNVDGKTVGTAVFNHLTGQMQLNGLNRAWR